MAKDKSFQAKLQKSSGDQSGSTAHCPKCGEAINTVQLITAEAAPRGYAYKFNQRFVGVCKCNSKEILG